MRFRPDQRPSKWGATAAVVDRQRAEDVVACLSALQGTPFDAVVRLSDLTEIKGYRYVLLQVSLDFNHPHFPRIADTLDELGGSEFQLIVVETPEGAVYLIVDKHNLPDEEMRPDHPLLRRLADWLGRAMASGG
ncbi:hypothetical protein [Symbiobacterium thermophilum]|uniref:hypothetical protein n=1 Tax=Symbiobacterium thermophilum TaxID=2734 RepID=UPI00030D0C5C|nr:hypothetical protein [Symbiobacterium thermophilum]